MLQLWRANQTDGNQAGTAELDFVSVDPRRDRRTLAAIVTRAAQLGAILLHIVRGLLVDDKVQALLSDWKPAGWD